MQSVPKVIVVGAGPTGLTLAAELAGHGIPCRILEQRPQRSPWSRAFGVQPHTLELLDMRGQAEAMVKEGLPCTLAPLGDGKNNMDFGRLDSRFPFMLVIPQSKVEGVLESWALQSGAELVREARVTALEQDDTGVTVHVEGPSGTWTERASFVVGCDGVRSTVRSLLGVPFQGSSYDCSLIIADVRLDKPPNPEVHARTGPRGMVAVFPYGDGTFRLVILDHERMHIPVDQPVTLEEIKECSDAILRVDLGIKDPVWMSRFRSDQRQAEQYRVNRILLAGDAAHTHMPSGGQGLQVGIQDAFNLGWKLAAELQGRAPPEVLSSYAQERHPVAAATLRKTDLVFQYEISRALPLRVIRWLATRLMLVRPLQIPILKEFAGLTLRYAPPSGVSVHSLVGRRSPDALIQHADGTTSRLYEMVRQRRFVLVDQTSDGSFAAQAEKGWGPKLTLLRGQVTDRRDIPSALLVRPDGFVAWALTRSGASELLATLRRWCGEPAQE